MIMGCLQSKNEVGSKPVQDPDRSQAESTATAEENTQEKATLQTESPTCQSVGVRSDNYDHLENFPIRDDEDVTKNGDNSATNDGLVGNSGDCEGGDDGGDDGGTCEGGDNGGGDDGGTCDGGDSGGGDDGTCDGGGDDD